MAEADAEGLATIGNFRGRHRWRVFRRPRRVSGRRSLVASRERGNDDGRHGREERSGCIARGISRRGNRQTARQTSSADRRPICRDCSGGIGDIAAWVPLPWLLPRDSDVRLLDCHYRPKWRGQMARCSRRDRFQSGGRGRIFLHAEKRSLAWAAFSSLSDWLRYFPIWPRVSQGHAKAAGRHFGVSNRRTGRSSARNVRIFR